MVGDVGGARARAGDSASIRATSSATLPLPITTARSRREVEVELRVVRVAVVPGDELGRGMAAGEILAVDPEAAVPRGPDRVEDRVVRGRELLVADVGADLDVAVEAEAGHPRRPLEHTGHRLDLRMVRRDAEADESPRGRQPVEHVDLDDRILAAQQLARRVEARRAGADDRDAQRPLGSSP